MPGVNEGAQAQHRATSRHEGEFAARSNASPSADSHSRQREWLSGFALVFLVLAAYAPVLRGGFVWDDTVLIDRNSLVTGETSLGTIWFNEDFPLSVVAFWLQWLLWGKQAVGYHVVNVLLHGANAVLVWRMLSRLQVHGAWLAAALFAAHPVAVASVAWISELKNTLSLLFFLLSIACYIRFDSEPSTSHFALRTSKWYWLSLTAFLLALLSKTTTVVLPGVLLGSIWWRQSLLSAGQTPVPILCGVCNTKSEPDASGFPRANQRPGVLGRTCVRTVPFFALALAFGLTTVWFQSNHVILGDRVQTESFWGRLAGAGWALWFYLSKAALPLNLNLIYPRWQIPAASLFAWVPLLLWSAVLGASWSFRRGWGRHALFAVGVFTVALLPALGFFDMYFLLISRVSDHFQYLALIAPVALLAAALRAWLPEMILQPVAAALLLGFAGLTFQRAGVFATDEGLWRDTLAKNPAAWVAHNNLGCVLAEQQKLDDAIQHFNTSLQLRPNNAEAQRNLGHALVLRGRFSEAEAPLRTAARLNPKDPETHKALARVLENRGDLQAAIAQLRTATRGTPDAEAHLQWGRLLRASGDFLGAVTQCRQALAAKPDSVEALNNLAWLLATSPDADMRNGTEAVHLAERACRATSSTNALMLGTLATAYAEAGRFTNAVTTAQQAVDLAKAGRNEQLVVLNQRMLRLYRAGLPYHEPQPSRNPSPP